MNVIGIDPGSRSTGFGLIRCEAKRIHYLSSGCIKTPEQNCFVRLKGIYEGIETVCNEYPVDSCAVEGVFVAENPNSAIMLGQARGAALAAVLAHDVPVQEHSPRQVKKVVVGTGSATKEQVQYMVKRLLNLDGEMSYDASDALAVAICHSFNRELADHSEAFQRSVNFFK